MKKIVVSGTKNSSNTAFSLAEASTAGGSTFIVHNGLVLQSVAASPGANQYTLSGTTLTLGLAPDAADSLFAFVTTSLRHGMTTTTLTGTQNGSNTVYTLGTAPPASSHLFLAFNGLVQEEVAAAPGANQFTISGTTVTLGLAPDSSDVLVAYIQESATVFFHELTLTGTQDSANTRFSSAFAYAAGYSPLLLVIHNGLILQETTSNSMTNQFVSSFRLGVVTAILGLAPAATDVLEIYSIGVTQSVGVTSLLNLRSLERRLIVLMNSMIDASESRMCLDEQWRMLTAEQLFSFMKTNGVVTTAPTKTAGTLSVTQDSILIVGSGTSPETADIGAFFLLDDQPYKIVSVDVTNQIYVVDAPYAGSTNTAITYTLYQNRYTLDPDVSLIVSMAGATWQLEEKSQTYLDWVDPDRTVFGEPYVFAYTGATSGGIEQIELWPVPDARYNLRYVGLKRSALDTATQTIHDISDVLLKFAAVLACRIVANKMAAAEKWQGTSHWTQQAEQWQRDAELGLQRFKKQDWKRWSRTRRTSSRLSGLIGRTDVDLSGW